MLEGIKGLFGKGRQTLDDLSTDELRKERIRLENEEKKLMKRLDDIEEEKKRTFIQGRDESSERKKMVLARKYKELDVQARNMERNMQYFSKQLRIVNGFLNLKENERILKASGLSNIISRMDLQELQIYVDEASIDGSFQFDKLQDVLTTLEEGGSLGGEIAEDKEVRDIFDEMVKAGDIDDAREIDDIVSRVNTKLAQADEEAQTKEPEWDDV